MRIMFALFTALVFAAFAAPASAERIDLTYSGSAWGLIPLGGATLSVDYDHDSYSATGMVRTSGLAALFLPTRIDVNSGGDIRSGDVRWRRYYLDHMYDGVHRYITMRPSGASVQADINPTYPEWGQPPTTDEQKANARDPLSSLIAMGVFVGENRRCEGDYLTFDGRWLYRLEMRGGEIEHREENGFIGDTLRCDLRYFPVAGFEPDDQGYRDPPPPGEVWFALLEGRRFAPPVRASMPLPLGRANLALRRWSINGERQTASN